MGAQHTASGVVRRAYTKICPVIQDVIDIDEVTGPLKATASKARGMSQIRTTYFSCYFLYVSFFLLWVSC